MRHIVCLLAALAIVVLLLPASAFASGNASSLDVALAMASGEPTLFISPRALVIAAYVLLAICIALTLVVWLLMRRLANSIPVRRIPISDREGWVSFPSMSLGDAALVFTPSSDARGTSATLTPG